MADRSVRVTLSAVVAPYVSSMARAAASTKAVGREITDVASRADTEFRTLRQAGLVVGAGIGGGLALASKSAIDFESAMAGVRKTLPEGADFDAITEGIREMARELPATHAEIAGVAEAAGQLGISAGGLLEFTRTMVDLGETTNLTADQAATAIARVGNIMQTSEGDVDRLGSALVALGNDGASTESEILDMAVRIASAGKQVGLTESDVLAFANTLSSLGIEAEAGGTAISRVMIDVAKAVAQGGDKLALFAGVAGQSAAQFAQAFEQDATGALVTFIEGLAGLDAAEMFRVLDELGLADMRVGNALRSLAGSGDLFRRSIELGSRAWQENTALTDEATQRYKTTAAQLDVLMNTLNDVAVGFGDLALPAINATSKGLADLLGEVGALPTPLKAAIGGLTALAGGGVAAITGLGFLMPKVRQGRQELEAMGRAGQVASRGLGLIGRAATYAVGLALLDQALDAVNDQLFKLQHGTVNADKLTNALVQLGQESRVTGELARIFGGDLGGINEALERLDPSTFSLTKINDDLAKLRSFGGIIGDDERAGLKDAKRDIDELDKSLAGLVDTGQRSLAQGILAGLADRGVDVDRLLEELDDYETSLARADTEQRTTGASAEALGGSFGELGEGIDEATEQLDELRDAFLGARDAEEAHDDARRGVADAADDIRDAEEQLTEAVRDQARAQEEAARAVERAQRALRSAQQDITRANYELGEAQEEAAARQRDYDEAVRDFGPNSKRAHDALEELEEANFKLGDSQFSLEEAHQRVRDANRELTEAHQRLRDEMNGVGDSADRVRDAEDRLGEAHERLGDAQATLLDATIGLERALDAEKEAFEGNNAAAGQLLEWLEQLKAKYPEVAAALQPLIDKLREVNELEAVPLDPNRAATLKAYAEVFGSGTGSNSALGAWPPPTPIPGLPTGRAAGGPVGAGHAYWVGERGRRELFVPSTDGRIVTQEQLARSVPFSAAQVGGGIDYERLAAAVARTAGPGGLVLHQHFHKHIDPMHAAADAAWLSGVRS